MRYLYDTKHNTSVVLNMQSIVRDYDRYTHLSSKIIRA